MKYVSLFSGIGGFDLALNRLGHECVYANDFDKYCKIIYDKNFCHCFNRSKDGRGKADQKRDEKKGEGLESQTGEAISASQRSFCQYASNECKQGAIHLDTRSITTVASSEIPDHDLLVGGFPCQAFSIAGRRKGFNDTRGTLFFEVARILDSKRPRYCLLENVKGLLSHDSGRTFRTIITTLDELGYDVQWQVLNSKNFGVPQNRERIYIIGHLRGERRPKVFPLLAGYPEDTRQITSTTIDANYWKGIDNHGQRTMIGTLRTHKDGEGFREMKSGVSPTIPARAREDGSGQPILMQGLSIRRLTPTECERLQSFPDGWTVGVSDTQRYKMLGNAVTSNVIYEIAKRFTIDNV